MRTSLGPSRRSTLLPAAVAGILVLLVAGCGPSTSAGSPSPSASAIASSAIPSATAETTASPGESAAPTESPSPTPLGKATPDRFWELVRAGLDVSGHLIATGDAVPAVVIRYRSDSSEALVDGDRVSICAASKSWAGESGAFEVIDGTWTCGFDALVTGFRASGAPIDSWSPDFPLDGSPKESVKASDGRWTWTLTGAGFDAASKATVTLDLASGRILRATLVDTSGTTNWSFDYTSSVEAIAHP